MNERRRELAIVSPVVVNIEDPEWLAFPLRRGLTWKRQRSELGAEFLPGIASFFNGALFSAEALDVVGVPDYRLFVRGDEVDVEMELDTAPREVSVPADLAAALDAEPAARRTFDGLSYSNKSWHVLQVEGAKTDDTRQRRIVRSVDILKQGRAR